jgi:hypothetical protein
MFFVLAITLWSLVLQIKSAFGAADATTVQTINGIVSLTLLGLAGALMVFGARALLEPQGSSGNPQPVS